MHDAPALGRLCSAQPMHAASPECTERGARLSGQEPLRIAMGAGAQTRDNPAVPLEQFQPAADTGGIFDRGAAGKRPLKLTARAAAR